MIRVRHTHNDIENEGETLRVKATVKAHEERDGVAQTLIARPKEIK